jgi:SAM-dependent methyltransferase
MDIATYAVEAEVEATHWWFAGRRKLFSREISALGIPPAARVLDIGTSTGTNLRMLKEMGFTRVTGLDPSDDAIRYCARKGLGTVRKGDVCSIPFEDGSFDLVLATDIIEHVDDDRRAVEEIRRVLAPGGVALFTVPAFQALWGLQDEVSHHKRRYRLADMERLMKQADMRILKGFYFNYLLFAPIFTARQIMRILKIKRASENELNTPLLNAIFYGIFSLDIATAGKLRPPFGVSLLMLVTGDRSSGRTDHGG